MSLYNHLLDFRLTPAVAVLIAFYCTLYKYVANGPLWPTNVKDLQGGCQKVWWQILLYIHNYNFFGKDNVVEDNSPSFAIQIQLLLFLVCGSFMVFGC